MQEAPDLGSLRAELRAAGVFELCEGRSWIKLAILFGGGAGSIVAMSFVPWWAIPFLIIACAVCCTSAAMLGHEGSHKAVSGSPTRNTILQYLTFPMFSGLSALYWREKHDRLHHGHPNVHSKDPDIKPYPFVSCREDHEKSGPLLRWFHRNFQSWAFWPMTPLMAAGMRRLSINFLFAYPRRHGFDRAWALDVLCLASHYVMWLVVPSLVWGPLIAFALYAAVWGVVGVLLVLIFAPAHIGLPVVHDQRHDWVHQLETTRNLELPRAVSWFFIGLDYQVEHHLFPKIPHQHLPRAAVITAAWCARHGIPYLTEPYLAALGDSTRFIHRAWRVTAAELGDSTGQLLRQSG